MSDIQFVDETRRILDASHVAYTNVVHVAKHITVTMRNGDTHSIATRDIETVEQLIDKLKLTLIPSIQSANKRNPIERLYRWLSDS